MQSLFLRDFTVLDFASLSESHGLSGESVYVSVELTGDRDEKGFILDFGPAKKILKALVDETLDHKLVVPALSPALSGTATGLAFTLASGNLTYDAPAEALAMLDETEITLPALENFLVEQARDRLPANVRGAKFFLREDPRFLVEPNFRYTHGLRLHEGNCQRLLHGHRNPVEVWVGGKRDRRGEEFLAAEWDNAHFVYAPSLEKSALDLVLGRRAFHLSGSAEVSYEAPQGFFRASVAASRIILLDQEPSIENIARLGHQRLRDEGWRGDLRVVAYEGLNKGASFGA